MITWVFGAMSDVNGIEICIHRNVCIFNSTVLNQPSNISGIVLICIALMLASIIILIKALHTESKMNTVIMIITLMMMTIGVLLLTLCGEWYEQIIPAIVPLELWILAIMSGERSQHSIAKWRIILFSVGCVSVTVGIVFSILSI
ncbi:unnamed protein product, partial [Schistosoma turkestanicum]